VLRRSAHTLKSNAAAFGATDLAEHCASLEARARAGEVSDVGDLVTRIAAAFDVARLALDTRG
jgi:HPt (histidine-containing phosphotransfer) domain-containing protein